MKTKKYFKSLILSLLISGMLIQTLAEAQENTQIQPTFSNAAQTNQATQRTGSATNNINPSLQAALDDLNAAQGQLDRSQMAGDQGQMMAAETTLNNAEDMYVGMLSRMSGVSEKDISDMNTAGATWPDVANELGVHGMTGKMENNNRGGIGSSNKKVKSGQTTMQHGSIGTMQMKSGDPDIKTDVQRNGIGGKMSGKTDPGSGMGNTDKKSHSGGMSHSMGDSESDTSGSGGHGNGGGSGGHGGGGGGRM